MNNRPRLNNASSNDQLNEPRKEISVEGKRFSTDSTIPTGQNRLPSTYSVMEKGHSQIITTQFSQGANTILSDSSPDNTILHHLPDQNETTDKSQQSLNDERVHRSPRKTHYQHHLVETRLRSASSIDERKQSSIPSIQYNIGPIETHEDLHDDNLVDAKQRSIREERKRKANENEQVLINVDEYATEILLYLKEREVRQCFLVFSSHFHRHFFSFLLAFVETKTGLYP